MNKLQTLTEKVKSLEQDFISLSELSESKGSPVVGVQQP